MASTRDKRITYIYRLPYSITQQICSNLDVDKAWSKLASEIGYTYQEVKTFELSYQYPSGSPTDKLLSDWGCRNPTATDLYNKLKSINRRREMQILEAWFTSSEEEVTVTRNDYPPSNAPSAGCSNILQDITKSALPKPPLPGTKSSDSSKGSSPKNSQCMGNVNVNIDKGSSGSKFMPDKMMEGKGIPSLDKPYNDKVFPGKAKINPDIDKLKKPTKDMKLEKSDKEDKGLLSVQENEISMTGSAEVAKDYVGNKSMDEEFHKKLENCEGYSMMNGSCDVDDVVAMMGTQSFSYKEINQATNGFSDNQKLGQGVYGEVYIGRLKNTNCAIKRLFPNKDGSGDDKSSHKHLRSELKTLTRYRHENIVSLYGYTLDGSEICLVYQHMLNGSLQDKLHCKNGTVPLSWEQRLTIMKGAACGLQYLHTLDGSAPLIHGDMKCTNILLDKHMEAKISDLGMARHATSGTSGVLTHITKDQTDTKQYQDRAYLPPEWFRGSVMSIKGDTYSFGVVLLEVCTGEKAYDEKREGSEASYLVSYVRNRIEGLSEKYIEPDSTGGNCPETEYRKLFDMAVRCTESIKRLRPDMVKVYNELEEVESSWNHLSSDSKLADSKAKALEEDDTLQSNSSNVTYSSGVQECQSGLTPLVISQPQDSSDTAIPFDQMPASYKLQVMCDQGNANLKTPDTADGNDFHNNLLATEKYYDKNPSTHPTVPFDQISDTSKVQGNVRTPDTADNNNVQNGVTTAGQYFTQNPTSVADIQNLGITSVGDLRTGACKVSVDVSDCDDAMLFNNHTGFSNQYMNSEQSPHGCEDQQYENLDHQNLEENEICKQQERDNFFKNYEIAAQTINQDYNGEEFGDFDAEISLDLNPEINDDDCTQLYETENVEQVRVGGCDENSSTENTGCEICEQTANVQEQNETFSASDLFRHQQRYQMYKKYADKLNKSESLVDGRLKVQCEQTSIHQNGDQSQNSTLQEVTNSDNSNIFSQKNVSQSNALWKQNRTEPSESEEFV